MVRGWILLALVLMGITGIHAACAESLKYVDVNEKEIQLDGDFSTEICISHVPSQRVEGGIRFYVNDRNYYTFFIRWEQDFRCDFYGAKYLDGFFKGFLIAEEYEETHKDCYVSVDETWDASYDSAMILRVSVHNGIAAVTMTGCDTGLSGTLHFDLNKSPWLNGQYTENTPTVWHSGALKSAVARARLVFFRIDEYTANNLQVCWPEEEPVEEKSTDSYYIPGRFKDEAGSSMPYQLHVPDNLEEGKKYPLILFMHGIGSNGMDNRQVINSPEMVICNQILEKEIDCFILVPQSPVGWIQEDNPVTTMRHSTLYSERKPSKYLACALAILEDIASHYPVDSNRIYYYGYSMGAIAGYYVLASYPDMFAGAILCAGVGFPDVAEHIAKTPLYVFHGTADDVVSYEDDKELCEMIIQVGGNVIFKSCQGYAHSISAPMRFDPDVIDWLFEQALR